MLKHNDLSRIDLNLLVLFDTVMAERHVARSAQRLNLTASAVSHGLKRLRAMLDDPLFLKTPRGVVPTQRASDLAPIVTDVLMRVRGIVETAEPFNPAQSTRRFTIAAPDGVSSVFLAPLLKRLKTAAPGIDLSLRQVLPKQGEMSPALAWRDTLDSLEARAMDIAVVPYGEFPTRFLTQTLYGEEFVIAMRRGHPFAEQRDLAAYCRMEHLVVSHGGDPAGFVDSALAERDLSRRVALTVPNFMFALSVLAEGDLVAALPGRFVERHGHRFGVMGVAPPLPLPSYQLTVVVPKVAMMDAGLAWMVGDLLASTSELRAS